MSDNDQIKKTILHFAESDTRVRTVLLNGSRANRNIMPDKYQDYDILFIVEDFDSFVNNENWVSFLGNTMITQLPDKMNLGKDKNTEQVSFAWLLIFKDGNRIDLTVFAVEKFQTHFKHDSLTEVWLDKDMLFKNIPESSDNDYHIVKPIEIEFSEVCNEFWWVCTYVAKGLARREILYAKDMMDRAVRPMFIKLIEWKVGIEYKFSVSFGKSGKFAAKYLSREFYGRVLKTYADSDIENNWDALFVMMETFKDMQIEIAEKLCFKNNADEAEGTFNYVSSVRKECMK